MPDARVNDTVRTAAAMSDAPRPVNPDRVGEELAEDANIWHVYDRVAREDDERRVKSWDNGLNNLALFAGLFSAVTTAFIIEAQQDLKIDYAELTFLVLNATASGETFAQPEFTVPPRARIISSIWVASLILSLSAALIAIMGKDWISTYTARPVCNLRQWAEMRTYRLHCVDKWYMSGVIAAAPVLLHVFLLLFGVGLVVFISPDASLHHLTFGLCLIAGALYLVTALSAVAFASSPFKSPATQMLRAALSALPSYMTGVVYRPKRGLYRNLLGAINVIVATGVDLSTTLPGDRTSEVQQRPPARRLLATMVSASRSAIRATRRSVPALLYTIRGGFLWSDVRLRVRTAMSKARAFQFGHWFTSATWAELSTDRRSELVADSLSWLNGASQAADVFRALIFALGDLDIGPQVAPLISVALRTRFSAEVRRTAQHVDLLSLSRYVLAEYNLRADCPRELWEPFFRFEVEKDASLRCEDALAAAVILRGGPVAIASHLPAHVAQARMVQFLRPAIVVRRPWAAETLISLANRYWSYLEGHTGFNLEAELYRCLHPQTRLDYASVVMNQYGGQPGPVELLTFFCHHLRTHPVTRRAAVQLTMGIVGSGPLRPHRCLAYLFGYSDLRHTAWTESRWLPSQLSRISFSLCGSLQQLCECTDSAQSGSWDDYTVALAYATAMVLSPQQRASGNVASECIQSLFTLLCGHQALLNAAAKLGVIRLLLEQAALYNIVGSGSTSCQIVDDKQSGWATGILATVTSHVRGLLRQPGTRRAGEQLFERLVFAKVRTTGADEAATWDLGDWIRTQAPRLVDRFPSTTLPMQEFHQSMTEIYALCLNNDELRTIWDRLGSPVRPSEMMSLAWCAGTKENMAPSRHEHVQDVCCAARNGLTIHAERDRGAGQPEATWCGKHSFTTAGRFNAILFVFISRL